VSESYPGMIANYRSTFAYMRKFDADIFLANHANFFHLADEANAFVDAGALQALNAQCEREFEAQLAKEQAAAAQ